MYHFTLAHRAISIAIKIKKWALPFVRCADQAKTKKRTAKAQSTASKNEGCKEEPGFRTKEKNVDTPASDSDGMLWTRDSGWMQTLINNTTANILSRLLLNQVFPDTIQDKDRYLWVQLGLSVY